MHPLSIPMNILALDQARNGAYSVWNYEKKKLIRYGTYSFPTKKFTYPQAIRRIELLVENLIRENDISAVFIEDINLRANVMAFKCLAQLQGVLINLFEQKELVYGLVPPATWQGFCKARGRTTKEKKAKVVEHNTQGKKNSKILSIQFAHDKFHIDTDNDDLCDCLCIGWYCVNNVEIETEDFKEK